MEEGAVTGAEDETAVKSEAGAGIEPETVEGKAPDRDDADGGITVSPSSGSHSISSPYFTISSSYTCIKSMTLPYFSGNIPSQYFGMT